MADDFKKADPERFSTPTSFAGEGADIDTSDLDKKVDNTEFAAALCGKLGINLIINGKKI